MGKQKVKLISVLLAATALFSTGSVFAENTNQTRAISPGETISPQFIALENKDCRLTISSGVATCYGYTKTSSGYIARVTVELQKLDGTWETIKTWNKMGSGMTAIINETYSVGSGTYRLKTTHQAFRGIDLIESHTMYTD